MKKRLILLLFTFYGFGGISCSINAMSTLRTTASRGAQMGIAFRNQTRNQIRERSTASRLKQAKNNENRQFLKNLNNQQSPISQEGKTLTENHNLPDFNKRWERDPAESHERPDFIKRWEANMTRKLKDQVIVLGLIMGAAELAYRNGLI